jgi:hypothetical protein
VRPSPMARVISKERLRHRPKSNVRTSVFARESSYPKFWCGGQNVTLQGTFTCDMEQYHLVLMLLKQPFAGHRLLGGKCFLSLQVLIF